MKRAATVCEDAVKARVAALTRTGEKISREGPIPKAREQEEYVLQAILPPEREMVARLLALPRPRGEGQRVGRMLRGLHQGLERIEAEPPIALKPVVITPADIQIEKYGLSECRV